MSIRTIVVVVLALGCGLMAAVGIAMMNGGGAAPIATRPVVFVVADVRRGEPIPRESVEVRQVPKDFALPTAIESMEDAEGRIARIPLLKNDLIVEAKLEPKGAKSRVVPPGMRAINVVASYPRDLDVGAHVDVFFTSNGPSGAGSTGLLPVLDLPVWDMPEPTARATSGNSGPVTLLVDPDQAGALNYGMNTGTARLLPRNPDDPNTPAPPPVAPPPPPRPPGLAASIEPGRRAYTIEATSAATRMAGLLRPGDFVDVIHARRNSNGGAEPASGPSATASRNVFSSAIGGADIAETVARLLKILAVNDAIDPESASKIDPKDVHSVTLLVTASQAARLDECQSSGSLHLALRAADDRDDGDEPEVSLAELPAVGDDDFGPAAVVTTRTLRGTSFGSDRLTIYRSPRVPRRPPGRSPLPIAARRR